MQITSATLFHCLRFQRGDTALIAAAASGSDSVVECLLENGAKVNHKNHVRLVGAAVWLLLLKPRLITGWPNCAVSCHWQEPSHGTTLFFGSFHSIKLA
jgi:ankyrin repeat protein